MKGLKITAKLIPYVLFQVLVLVLIGVADLIALGWDLSQLLDPVYWFKYITLTLATIISFFTWANLRIDRLTNKPYKKGMETDPNTDLNNLGNQVAIKKVTLSSLVMEHKTADLSIFLWDVYNKPEKTNRYVHIKKSKIAKLKNKRRYGISKSINRKIAVLEEALDPAYIEHNIKDLKVKYAPVTEAYIVNGTITVDSMMFRHRQESKVLKMFKDNWYRWAMSLGYSLLLISVIPETTKEITWALAFTTGIRVVQCIMQSIMGANYGSAYVEEKVIYELDDRTSIMEHYMEWKNAKKEVHINGEKEVV